MELKDLKGSDVKVKMAKYWDSIVDIIDLKALNAFLVIYVLVFLILTRCILLILKVRGKSHNWQIFESPCKNSRELTIECI